MSSFVPLLQAAKHSMAQTSCDWQGEVHEDNHYVEKMDRKMKDYNWVFDLLKERTQAALIIAAFVHTSLNMSISETVSC